MGCLSLTLNLNLEPNPNPNPNWKVIELANCPKLESAEVLLRVPNLKSAHVKGASAKAQAWWKAHFGGA